MNATEHTMASLLASSAIDLSFPIDEDHFRWHHERTVVDRLAEGAPFETSRFTMSAHAFTHADAPSHVAIDGHPLGEVPVTTWVGRAVVLDVSHVGARNAVTASALRAANPGFGRDDIVLVRTDWDRRRDIRTPQYWADAPWLDEHAARWLAEAQPRAVGFDFPQDEAIRRTLHGEPGRPEEFVTHHWLLRHGIGLIEYLRGLDQLHGEVLLVAAPIALTGSDGGPVRAIAIPTTTATASLHTTRTEGSL